MFTNKFLNKKKDLVTINHSYLITFKKILKEVPFYLSVKLIIKKEKKKAMDIKAVRV